MANKLNYTVEYTSTLDITQVRKSLEQLRKLVTSSNIGASLSKELEKSFSSLESSLNRLSGYARKNVFNPDEARDYASTITTVSKNLDSLYKKFTGAKVFMTDEQLANFKVLQQTVHDYEKTLQSLQKETLKQPQFEQLETLKKNPEYTRIINELLSYTDAEKQAAAASKLLSAANEEVINTSMKYESTVKAQAEALLKLRSKDLRKGVYEEVLGQPLGYGQATKVTEAIRKYKDDAAGLGEELKKIFGTDINSQIGQQANSIKALSEKQETLKTITDLAAQALEEMAKKPEFSSLQNGLEELSNKMKEMEAATDSAGKELEETGKTTIGEVTREVSKLGAGLSKATQEGEQNALTTQALDATFKTLVTHIRNSVSALTIFYKTTQIIRKAVDSIKEFDKAFTDIAVVSGKAREEVWQYFEEYNRLARQYSITTQDLAEGAKLFYQQGLNTYDTMKMIESSTISAALGGVTMTEATDTLTAALNGYNASASEALNFTDKIAVVGASSAADFNELSYSMEKVASSAYTAGIDFDHLLAYLGKMIEVTRESPENLGTSLKTIIARFQDLKVNPLQALEDGTDMNKVQKALASVGVSLLDESGQFRALGEVIDDLGRIWKTLDRNTQAYIATIAAGSRQQSRFLALMNDYDRTLELVNAAQNSSGAAMKQYSIYQSGVEAAFNRMSAAWEKTYTTIISSDAIIKIINDLTHLLDVVNKLPPSITALGAVFAALTANKVLGILTSEAFFKAPNRLLYFNKQLFSMGDTFKDLGTKAGVAAKSVKGFFTTLGLVKSLSLVAALAAVTVAIVAIANAATKGKKQAEALSAQISELKKVAEEKATQASALTGLLASYTELADKLSLTTQEQRSLNDIINQIKEIYPDAIIYIDEMGNSHLRNAEAIKSEIEAQKEASKAAKVAANEKTIEYLRNTEFRNMTEEQLANLGAPANIVTLFKARKAYGVPEDQDTFFSKIFPGVSGLLEPAQQEIADIEAAAITNQLGRIVALQAKTNMEQLLPDETLAKLREEFTTKTEEYFNNPEYYKALAEETKQYIKEYYDVVESFNQAEQDAIIKMTGENLSALLGKNASIFSEIISNPKEYGFDPDKITEEEMMGLKEALDRLSQDNQLALTKGFSEWMEGSISAVDFVGILRKALGDDFAQIPQVVREGLERESRTTQTEVDKLVSKITPYVNNQTQISPAGYVQGLTTKQRATFNAQLTSLNENERGPFVQYMMSETEQYRQLEEQLMKEVADSPARVFQKINEIAETLQTQFGDQPAVADAIINALFSDLQQQAEYTVANSIEKGVVSAIEGLDLSAELNAENLQKLATYEVQGKTSMTMSDITFNSESGKAYLSLAAQITAEYDRERDKLAQIERLVADLQGKRQAALLTESSFTAEEESQLRAYEAQLNIQKAIVSQVSAQANAAQKAANTTLNLASAYKNNVDLVNELNSQMDKYGEIIDYSKAQQLLALNDTYSAYVQFVDGKVKLEEGGANAILDIEKQTYEQKIQALIKETEAKATVLDAEAAMYEAAATVYDQLESGKITITKDSAQNRATIESALTNTLNENEDIRVLNNQKGNEAIVTNIAIAAKQIAELLAAAFEGNVQEVIALSGTINQIGKITGQAGTDLVNAAVTETKGLSDQWRDQAKILRAQADSLRQSISYLENLDPLAMEKVASSIDNVGASSGEAADKTEDFAKAALDAAKAVLELGTALDDYLRDIKHSTINFEPFLETMDAWEHQWEEFYNIKRLMSRISEEATYIQNIIDNTSTSGEDMVKAYKAKVGNLISEMSASNSYITLLKNSMSEAALELKKLYGQYYQIDETTLQIYENTGNLNEINNTLDAQIEKIYNLNKLQNEAANNLALKQGVLSAQEEALSQLQTALSTVESEINSLQDIADVSDLVAQQTALQAQIQAKKNAIDTLKTEIDKLNEEIANRDIDLQLQEKLKQQLEDYVNDMESLVEEYSNYYSELVATVQDQQLNASQLLEMQNSLIQNAATVQQQIYDAIVESYQKEIDAKQKEYEMLKQLDQEYLESVRQTIQAERDARTKASSEREYQQKVQRAQLLQMDTSGAYAGELASLQKEIEQAQTERYDQLIDEQLSNLEKEVNKRAELYDKEVKALQDRLAFYQENAILLWDQVDAIFAQGASTVMALLENTNAYLAQNELLKEQQRQAWEQNIALAIEGVSYDMIDVLGQLAEAARTSVIDTYPEIETALNNYNQVFTDSAVIIQANSSTIGQANDSITNKVAIFNTIMDTYMNEWNSRTSLLTGYADTWSETMEILKQNTKQNLQELTDTTSNGIIQFGANIAQATQEAYQAIIQEKNNAIQTFESALAEIKNGIVDAFNNVIAAINSAASKISGSGSTATTGGTTTGGTTTGGTTPGGTTPGGGTTTGTQWFWYGVGVDGSKQVGGPFATQAEAMAALNAWKPSTLRAGSGLVKSLEEAKRYAGIAFSKGGLADFTGPAWLDGTKQEPERVLSPTQTKLFDNLVSSLEKLSSAKTFSTTESNDTSVTIGSISVPIEVQSLSDQMDVRQMAKLVMQEIADVVKIKGNVSVMKGIY